MGIPGFYHSLGQGDPPLELSMFRGFVFLGMFYNMYQIFILQTLSFCMDSAWKVEIEGSQAVDAFSHFQIRDFFRGGGETFLVGMPFHIFFP